MRHIVILLLLAGAAIAGPGNSGGPAAVDIKALWSTPTTVTTAGLTTTSAYFIGLDSQCSIDVSLTNVAATKQVTLTALFEFPGGNFVAYPVEAIPTEQYVWEKGVDPGSFLFEVFPPRGAQKLYLHAITNDTDGVSATARVLGRP